MNESINPSGSTAGVFIHDLSVRFNEQVVPLEALDPAEVLAESKLQLAGSVAGKVGSKVRIHYEQSYRPFFATSFSSGDERLNLGKFRIDLKLRNGMNNFVIKAVDEGGNTLDSKEFHLSYKGSFREWNETIFIAFFLAILIRGLVAQAFWIPTGSMEPTLLGEAKDINGVVTRNGDRILVNRFAYAFDFSLDGRLPFFSNPKYWLKYPERGDIVVFKFPDPEPGNPPRDYIKRVVGVPGDRVDIRDGVTYVNDIALDEPYIAQKPTRDYSVIVKEGYLFVMGDNRNNSYDSRYWGLMPLKNLKGQAIFSYLPLNRIGPIKSYSHDNVRMGNAVKSSF